MAVADEGTETAVEVISFVYPPDETRLFVRGFPEDTVCILRSHATAYYALMPPAALRLFLDGASPGGLTVLSLLPACCCPPKSYRHLVTAFSRFGPLHEVQLQAVPQNRAREGYREDSGGVGFSPFGGRCYAFVQYYSVRDAREALRACRQKRVLVHHHPLTASPVERRTTVRYT